MTASRPRIRPAAPGDAAALARLRLAFRSEVAVPEESPAGFLARCERWMASRLAGSVWRAWLAEVELAGAGVAAVAAVGTIWLQLLEKLPNPVGEPEWHGYVSSLYVEPEWRDAGLGSGLLGICLAECERAGVDAVVLWPTARSRSLYLRHGFDVRDDLLERRTAHAGGPAGL